MAALEGPCGVCGFIGERSKYIPHDCYWVIRTGGTVDSYERLKAQHDEILQRQARELAKRIGDECFGEATEQQIERIYLVITKSPGYYQIID